MSPLTTLEQRLYDALEVAWALIANAGCDPRPGPVVHTLDDGTQLHDSGWCRESAGWESAAIRWRDEHLHPLLDDHSKLVAS